MKFKHGYGQTYCNLTPLPTHCNPTHISNGRKNKKYEAQLNLFLRKPNGVLRFHQQHWSVTYPQHVNKSWALPPQTRWKSACSSVAMLAYSYLALWRVPCQPQHSLQETPQWGGSSTHQGPWARCLAAEAFWECGSCQTITKYWPQRDWLIPVTHTYTSSQYQ